MKLDELIGKVNDGLNPIVKFSGEEYKIEEVKMFGDKPYFIISKVGQIKQLMISASNKDLEY